jgi:hypothetical protein
MRGAAAYQAFEAALAASAAGPDGAPTRGAVSA